MFAKFEECRSKHNSGFCCACVFLCSAFRPHSHLRFKHQQLQLRALRAWLHGLPNPFKTSTELKLLPERIMSLCFVWAAHSKLCKHCEQIFLYRQHTHTTDREYTLGPKWDQLLPTKMVAMNIFPATPLGQWKMCLQRLKSPYKCCFASNITLVHTCVWSRVSEVELLCAVFLAGSCYCYVIFCCYSTEREWERWPVQMNRPSYIVQHAEMDSNAAQQ